ncbi:MAG: hypothetical protein NC222_06100 [Staphylococcus sp.]|nr:hypothetical protein [Staphylococcus sp.]
MVLKFNNNSIENVQYNGSDINVLQYNGTTVWERVPTGTVLFESSTAGTYSVSVPVAGDYECILVGGGGGAAGSVHKSSVLPSYAAITVPGGSGAYIKATLTLPVCTLNVVVGAKGTAKYINKINVGATNWTTTATAGTASYLKRTTDTKNILEAGGGGAGSLTVKTAATISGTTWRTITLGTAGNWAYNTVTGVTQSNRTTVVGKTGTEDVKNLTSQTASKITATSSPVASNLSTYGRGQGMTCYINNEDWAFTYNNTTYNSSDGYVIIKKV